MCVEEIKNEEAETIGRRSRLRNKHHTAVSHLMDDRTVEIIEATKIKKVMKAIVHDPETEVHVPPACLPSLGPVAAAGHEKARVALDEAYRSPLR